MTARRHPSPRRGRPAAARSAAQLTYTSSIPARSGGWQIKEVTAPGPRASGRAWSSESSRHSIRAAAAAVSRSDQIDSRPRRLSHQVIGGGAYWHTVDAGRDARRPGNVFAHVALDRRPIAARADRPIVRWRSPDWLVPYGRRTWPRPPLAGPELPRPNPDINVVSAVDFCSAATSTVRVFRCCSTLSPRRLPADHRWCC